MNPDSCSMPIGEIYIGDTPLKEFNICYDRTIPYPQSFAAAELQAYLARSCGVTIPVLRGMWGKSGHEFILGPCEKNPDVPKDLGPDGIYIEVKDGNVHLCGEGTRGTLYALYTFLEEYVGWRFFTPTLETLSPCETLVIPEGARKVFSPPFVFRQTSWGSTLDNAYAVKRHLNVQSGEYSGIFLSRRYGGGISYVKNLGCHTFDDFMLKRNYPDHPEYFADIRGENPQGENTPPPDGQEELCLTNPDVIRIVTEKVGRWLAAAENPTLISISQNDNANGYCRCKNCAAQGTPTDNYLKFVSKIADHFKDQYPNVIFEMLAYHYTQSPPSPGVRVPRNVGARLCSIRTCAAHAFDDETCPGHLYGRGANQKFVRDLKGWAKVCRNVSVWDYTTDFSYYLSPFPNFEALRRNAAFHKKAGTSRLFLQGNGEHSGEFGELRGYLIAKLIWNPSMSKKEYYRHMNEFLEAYYGSGWKQIRAYIDLIEDHAHRGNNNFFYYTSPCGLQSNPDADKIIPASDAAFLEQALALWEKAAKRAKTDAQKENIARSRLSIRYYELCASYAHEWQNGTPEQKEAYEQKNREFHCDLLRARVPIAEGIALPSNFNPELPPHTWTGKPL